MRDLKEPMVKCHLILLIDTLDRHLNPHPVQYSIDTQSTLDQQLAHSWLSVDPTHGLVTPDKC